MHADLDPPQPDPVVRAVESLLAAEEPPPPDAWWDEGLREALES